MQANVWNYFSGFCIMEANLIASGFGYSNPDSTGKESYNNIREIRIIIIETSTTF
jgi:hypothetical protein